MPCDATSSTRGTDANNSHHYEPELGLHPFSITILAELVRKSDSQVIISTQSVELLNEFDVEDVIVADRGQNGTELKRLDPEALEMWIEDYSLGDLWLKNVLVGGDTIRLYFKRKN